MSLNRREVVGGGVLVGGALVVLGGALAKGRSSSQAGATTGPESARAVPTLDPAATEAAEDPLVRMQRELPKAMAKPVEQRRWAMVIDQRKCVGCHACTIGCVAENKLPPGVVYRPVITEESGTYPNLKITFTPRPCMQCEEPPCTPVCPVHATWRRPDGITVVDYDKCIGCRYCLTACPYGARTSDFGEQYSDGATQEDAGQAVQAAPVAYESKPNHEYAKNWSREDHGSPVGNARKCHFCLHRLENGQLPMCVTTCIGRATYFGDLNDPEAMVSELVGRESVHRLLPHMHTSPRVFYIS